MTDGASGTSSRLGLIQRAIEREDHERAEWLAGNLRRDLGALPEAQREAAIAELRGALQLMPEAQQPLLAELLGLDRPEAPDELDRGIEGILSDLVETAALLEGAERDSYIRSAIPLIARMDDLGQQRWRMRFSRELHVPAKVFDMLLAEAKRKAAGNGASPSANGQPHRFLAEVKDGRICFLDEPLGNFSARITHELIVDDGQNMPAVRYTLEGALASGENLGAVDVPAEDFDGMKWLPRHWGARPVLYVSPGKAWIVRRAIQELSLPAMKRERVHTFTGWASIAGKRAFLSSSGAIGAEGFDPSVRVELGSSTLKLYALPEPPGDPREAVRASLRFLDLAPHPISVPLWAAMYAAPLTSFFSLNAVLWVYGSTQSRKSTLAMLALTHFGPGFVKGRDYKAPKDWMSTVTDLEGAMFCAKDMPLVYLLNKSG